MGSEKLIANELLAFITHAIDSMDEVSILQICKSSFKEEEICSAKVLLYESLDKLDRMPTRRRDEKGERSIQDIVKLLKETDPDDVPTFVAKQLHKLPPVTFDHVDVTRLLKDITTLKASLAEVKFRLEVSETTIGELRTELLSLKHNDSVSRSPTEASNINLCRGAQINASVCSIASPPAVAVRDAPRPAVLARSPQQTSAKTSSNTSPRAYAAVAATSTPPALQQRPSLTRKSPRKISSAPALQIVPRQPYTDSQDRKVDQGGFTLVEKRRRPRPARNQRGTATTATSTLIKVAEPTIAIYLSRFDKNTSGEEVLRYIKQKSQEPGRCVQLHNISLARLESSRTTTFKSYVFQFPAKYKAMLLAPDFWPDGIVFRRYREARPNNMNP